VPRGGNKFADITMKMATTDGALDLRDLADCVESRFDKRALKNRLPSLDVFDAWASAPTVRAERPSGCSPVSRPASR
jgi:hypothetical protein